MEKFENFWENLRKSELNLRNLEKFENFLGKICEILKNNYFRNFQKQLIDFQENLGNFLNNLIKFSENL